MGSSYVWVPARETVYELSYCGPFSTFPGAAFVAALREDPKVRDDYKAFFYRDDMVLYLQGRGVDMDSVKLVTVKG